MAGFSPCNGVTILICTYNGATRLSTTLEHIKAQKVPSDIPWEVLIISNASSDNTVEVANQLCAQLVLQVPCRVLDEPRTGKENALVQGFDKATYECIIIVDDDNWLAPNYVELVYTIMSTNADIGILGGYAEGAYEVSPPKWFYNFEAVYAIGPQNGGNNGPLPAYEGYVYGAGSTVRKSAWQKLRAQGFVFTTSTKRGKIIASAEDLELGDAFRLAGYKLWYDDRLRFKHFMLKERLTWSYLLRMARGTATSQITSVVYYFIFRYPNLTETSFRRLYAKRLVWVSMQIARQPKALFDTLLRPKQENLLHNFEMLRLLYNLKVSIAQREYAVEVFRQVQLLKSRLAIEVKQINNEAGQIT